jgi:hypothetical protein
MLGIMADYSGMTVNERLAVAGLTGEWDCAITAGDRESAMDVLTRVGMAPRLGAQTVDVTLANPELYGFPSRG